MMKKNPLDVVDVVNLVEMVGKKKKNFFVSIHYQLFNIVVRTLVDTSKSASPTTVRLPNGVRSVSKKRSIVFF